MHVHARVCACVYMCATAPPWWQGVSIMINRQTRRLSHAITLHYGSQDFKVKMNGSSSTWGLHISSFFCFLSLFYFLEETCLPAPFCSEDHSCFCYCLKCMMGNMDFEQDRKKRNLLYSSFSIKPFMITLIFTPHLYQRKNMFEGFEHLKFATPQFTKKNMNICIMCKACAAMDGRNAVLYKALT